MQVTGCKNFEDIITGQIINSLNGALARDDLLFKEVEMQSLIAFGCLFVFLLYVPIQQLRSWPDGQFTLPHFFPGQA